MKAKSRRSVLFHIQFILFDKGIHLRPNILEEMYIFPFLNSALFTKHQLKVTGWKQKEDLSVNRLPTLATLLKKQQRMKSPYGLDTMTALGSMDSQIQCFTSIYISSHFLPSRLDSGCYPPNVCSILQAKWPSEPFLVQVPKPHESLTSLVFRLSSLQ